MRSGLRDDDLVRICVNDQICIVRDHDHLTFVLGLPEQVHEFIEDRLGVQIFFGLVDDKGPIIGIVEREVKKQQDDASGARRQLFECRPHRSRRCIGFRYVRCHRAIWRNVLTILDS